MSNQVLKQRSKSISRKSSVQQPPPKSTLQQTLQQIQNRVNFFATEKLSAQNSLNPSNNFTVRSISQIITPLKYYQIGQTPLNMNLSAIYTSQQIRGSLKWSIPPPSQGQDSINQQQTFQPSFKWLISAFVDPNLLHLDQPQPRRIQKGKVPQDWNGITSIMLWKATALKIYNKQQVKEFQDNIIKKKLPLQKYASWLKYKRMKEIYYKGKPAIILKFADPNSAAFVYFHYATFRSNRDDFGPQCQVFRVQKDQTKDYSKQKNWIPVLFRHLPLSMTKQQLLSLFQTKSGNQIPSSQQHIYQNVKVDIKWVEELVEIGGYKYTLAKVSYLDQALQLCSVFNSKKIRDAKVNIHPRSSKNWKAQQIISNDQSEPMQIESNGAMNNENMNKG